jgi:hypothetical protein
MSYYCLIATRPRCDYDKAPPFYSLIKQHGGGEVDMKNSDDGSIISAFAWFKTLPKTHETLRQQLRGAGWTGASFVSRDKWILK